MSNQEKEVINLSKTSIPESVDWLLSVGEEGMPDIYKSGITMNHDRASGVIPCKICGKKGKNFPKGKRAMFGFYNGAHDKCIMFYCNEHALQVKESIESRGFVVLDESTVEGSVNILLSTPDVEAGIFEAAGATDIFEGPHGVGNIPCRICGKKGNNQAEGAGRLTYAFINTKHERGIRFFCLEHAEQIESLLIERGIHVVTDEQKKEVEEKLNISMATEEVVEETIEEIIAEVVEDGEPETNS